MATMRVEGLEVLKKNLGIAEKLVFERIMDGTEFGCQLVANRTKQIMAEKIYTAEALKRSGSIHRKLTGNLRNSVQGLGDFASSNSSKSFAAPTREDFVKRLLNSVEGIVWVGMEYAMYVERRKPSLFPALEQSANQVKNIMMRVLRGSQ